MERKHLPYVGWGHKLLPGETFRPDMSKAQADSFQSGFEETVQDVQPFRKGCPFSRHPFIMWILPCASAMARYPRAGLFKSWKGRGQGHLQRVVSHSGATRGKWYRALNGEEKWNICYCLRSKRRGRIIQLASDRRFSLFL